MTLNDETLQTLRDKWEENRRQFIRTAAIQIYCINVDISEELAVAAAVDLWNELESVFKKEAKSDQG